MSRNRRSRGVVAVVPSPSSLRGRAPPAAAPTALAGGSTSFVEGSCALLAVRRGRDPVPVQDPPPARVLGDRQLESVAAIPPKILLREEYRVDRSPLAMQLSMRLVGRETAIQAKSTKRMCHLAY